MEFSVVTAFFLIFFIAVFFSSVYAGRYMDNVVKKIQLQGDLLSFYWID